MKHQEAIKFCKEQGRRLPTARELGKYAQTLGAEGVSETEKASNYPVHARTANGEFDYFYYSRTGYVRPTGDLGDRGLWSSSYYNTKDLAFALNAENGALSSDSSGEAIPVRCVR